MRVAAAPLTTGPSPPAEKTLGAPGAPPQIGAKLGGPWGPQEKRRAADTAGESGIGNGRRKAFRGGAPPRGPLRRLTAGQKGGTETEERGTETETGAGTEREIETETGKGTGGVRKRTGDLQTTRELAGDPRAATRPGSAAAHAR